MFYFLTLVLFEWSSQEELNERGKWLVWETGEVRRGFWWRNLRERNHLEALGVDGEIILRHL